MKIIHGWFFLPWSNKSLTLEAPTPTNISTKSAPLKLKKATLASPATARASNVFPVPGGPTSNTPLGILAPSFSYCLGFFKNSTTSPNSSFASTQPATSSNVTLGISDVHILALLFPKLNIDFIPPFPACILLIKKIQKPKISTQGSKLRK